MNENKSSNTNIGCSGCDSIFQGIGCIILVVAIGLLCNAEKTISFLERIIEAF